MKTKNKKPETKIETVIDKIRFEDKYHKYFIDSKSESTELISVTKFISSFFPKFNRDKEAKRYGSKIGKSTEDVITMWEQSSTTGTLIHEYAEYLSGKRNTPPKITSKDPKISFREINLYKTIDKFFKDYNPHTWFTERIIGSKKYKIAGTIDWGGNISINNGPGLVLLDWKTNNKIHLVNSWNNKKAKLPINCLDDCNYTKYAMQLSLYRFILEDEYNEFIDQTYIVHITPDGYYIYPVPYLKKLILEILKTRL